MHEPINCSQASRFWCLPPRASVLFIRVTFIHLGFYWWVATRSRRVCWRFIRAECLWGSAAGLPAGPLADNRALSPSSELWKHADGATRVDAVCHHVLPLCLAIEVGPFGRCLHYRVKISRQNFEKESTSVDNVQHEGWAMMVTALAPRRSQAIAVGSRRSWCFTFADNLRPGSRFQDLLRRMNFPP